MTQPFPLYDELIERSTKFSEISDLTKLGTALCNLEKNDAEIVFAMIYHHRQKELAKTGSIPLSLPYMPKLLNKGRSIFYEFSNLPTELCKILHCFVSLREETPS